MFGQQQQSYGPWNALADILGAYWQKRSTEGAMDYAANFNPITQDQTAAPQQQNQSIIQAAQNYVSNTTNPLDKAIAQGVNGNLTAPMGQITGNASSLTGSLLKAAQNYGQNNNLPTETQNMQAGDAISNNLNQQQAQYDQQQAQQQAAAQKAALQKQYNDFAAAKAANPEWYVGDTYVGTDPKARQAAIQQQINVANKAFQDRRNTYNQYKSQVVSMKAKAMKDLINKYGANAAKLVEPMIDSAIQNKMTTMAQQIDEQNRQWLAPYIMGDQVNTPQGLQRALWATQEYNNVAKQMGLSGVDIPTVGKMLDAGQVAITSKDLGNGITFYAVPKNGGTFDDGSYIKPILTASKGVSPDMSAQLTERKYEHDTASGNAKLQSSTQLKTTQMNNNSREKIASAEISAKQNSNQGVAQKVSALKAIINDPSVDDGTRQQAESELKALAGISNTDSSTNDPVGNWISAAYSHGYTKEQIQQALRDKGYGDSYDSWLY